VIYSLIIIRGRPFHSFSVRTCFIPGFETVLSVNVNKVLLQPASGHSQHVALPVRAGASITVHPGTVSGATYAPTMTMKLHDEGLAALRVNIEETFTAKPDAFCARPVGYGDTPLHRCALLCLKAANNGPVTGWVFRRMPNVCSTY
jgi:hypothetical protein